MTKKLNKEIFHSEITAVTVFKDIALIRRTATVEIEKGNWDVVISPIPSKAKPESFRVRLKTLKGSAKLKGLNYTQEYKSYSDLEDKELLEREIHYLEGQIYDIRAKLDLCKRKKDFLSSIETRSINEAQIQMTAEKPSPEDWEKAFNFIFQIEESIIKEEKGYREKLDEFERKLEDKKKQLAKWQTPSLETYYFAHVYMDVEKAGKFEISIDYLIDDASWFPDYELRVDKQKGECFFTYCGIVYQNTGEDWNDAELSLSTALPAKELKIPEIQRWNIRGMHSPGDEGEERESEEPVVLEKDLSEEGAPGITLNTEQRVHIPSTGEPVKVIIEHDKPLEGKIVRKCLPQQCPNLFLYANTLNPFDFPILPGKVTIFHDNNFNGETRIGTVTPKEHFILEAGIEDEMDVTWKLNEKKKKKVEKGVQYILTYTGKISNRTGYKVPVELILSLPVSRDKNISVKSTTLKPSGFEHPEENLATLITDIESEETLEFSLSFKVECSKDTEIHGITLF